MRKDESMIKPVAWEWPGEDVRHGLIIPLNKSTIDLLSGIVDGDGLRAECVLACPLCVSMDLTHNLQNVVYETAAEEWRERRGGMKAGRRARFRTRISADWANEREGWRKGAIEAEGRNRRSPTAVLGA